MRVASFADRVARLQGWRRAGASFSLGALSVAALPPINFVPVLLLALPGLLLLLGGCRSGRGSFFTGWCFGFGHHLLGLYWISNAFLIDAGSFAWLIPVIGSGLPALLALFIGAACWAAWRFAEPGWPRVLAFAAAWVAGEWVRGHLFTGFPWNLAGYVWSGSTPMLQVTSVIGVYGLSLLTVLAASAPAALLLGRAHARRPAAILLVVSWGLLLMSGIGGFARLAGADPDGRVPGVRLRIVQANVPQSLKWKPEERVAVFRRHLEMSRAPAAMPPTAIIWPETAVPFYLADEPVGLQAIGELLPPGTTLLTGAPRAARDTGELQVWNSLLAIDGNGRVVATFDKFHLVPLGEYVPFRGWLDLAKVTPGTVDFTPGPGPQTLTVPGLPPFSPLICYEVIFPRAVVGTDRPAWLLNITNDGWYGRSTGPHQHLEIARVRAIEEGLPLVRAANTGISAVVDPYGRYTARLGLMETGVIDTELPKPLPAPTIYARAGDLPLIFLLLVVTAVPLWRAATAGRRQPSRESLPASH